MRFQKKMGLENIVSLAASPIVARKRQSDSPCVRRKVSSWNIRYFGHIDTLIRLLSIQYLFLRLVTFDFYRRHRDQGYPQYPPLCLPKNYPT